MNDFEKKASGFSEVPPEAVEHSEATKAKRERSLAQLPVYREASKLLEMTVRFVLVGPQSLRRYYDTLILNASEILKAIALADRAKDDRETRVYYIDWAYSLVNVEKTYFGILHRAGLLRKGDNDRLKATVGCITAQLVGWRDYTRGEGAVQKSEAI